VRTSASTRKALSVFAAGVTAGIVGRDRGFESFSFQRRVKCEPENDIEPRGSTIDDRSAFSIRWSRAAAMPISPMRFRRPALRRRRAIEWAALIIAGYSLSLARSRRAAANKIMGFAVQEERERMVGYGRFEHVIDALETAVSRGEWLVGDRFTAADVYVGSHMDFGSSSARSRSAPPSSSIDGGLCARPAVLRAKQIDDSLAGLQQAQTPG
jgi:hypothetical protein